MADKTNSDELLFTEVTISGVTVKQLSYGDFNSITSDILNVFDLVSPLLANAMSTSVKGKLPPIEMVRLILNILPHLTPIIAKACKVDTAIISALPASTGIQIAAALWNLNEDVITDFFGIAASQVQKQ